MIMITTTYLKVSNYSHFNSSEHVYSIDSAQRNILIYVACFQILPPFNLTRLSYLKDISCFKRWAVEIFTQNVKY